jgi:hypothetical protein
MRREAAMLPFTQDQFVAVFVAYNEAVWPAPIAAYLLGGLAVYLAARRRELAARIVPGILGLLWLWNGVAYHWLYFRPINPAATVFGAAFVIQGLLLLVYGSALGRLGFATQAPLRHWAGLTLIAYAMLLYPLLGLAAGHVYPAAPVFGITPCPLTIFTFGVLLLANGSPWLLVVVPALWSVVGGSAAVLLGVPEDWMLPVAGLITVALMVWTARHRRPTLAVAGPR